MVLQTPRLLLRDFVESDAVDANAYEADPGVVRYAAHGVRSLHESREQIRALLADAAGKTRKTFDFALIERERGVLIGRCGFQLSEVEHSEAMLWYVLARKEWGRGYALEAAQAVLAFAFEQLRLHRVFVDIDPRNTASLRVAEKLGLRREGHFLETKWVKGEWTDTVVFALLDREHRARFLKAPAHASRHG